MLAHQCAKLVPAVSGRTLIARLAELQLNGSGFWHSQNSGKYDGSGLLRVICPSLKAAVDNANASLLWFQDDTNAPFRRTGLVRAKITEGIRYARQRGVKVFLALNTYPQPSGWSRWQSAVDQAVDLGVDAMIAADIGCWIMHQAVIPN